MKIENIDKFGHCVICHRNLIKNVVINGKVEGVFDSDKDEAFLKLNINSLMPICICKPCKASVDLTDTATHERIMEAVQEGWKLEMHMMRDNPDKFPDWTPEKHEKLQKHYDNLKIMEYVKT
jgi:hypothetical protein